MIYIIEMFSSIQIKSWEEKYSRFKQYDGQPLNLWSNETKACI